MEKTLLLAAFLASTNPQETDSTTFGNELKGRKKKLRAGEDPDQVVNPTTRDVLNSPCTFGLERLLAIYLQIYLSTSNQLLPSLWYSSSLSSSNNYSQPAPSLTESKEKILFYGHQESAIYSTVSY